MVFARFRMYEIPEQFYGNLFVLNIGIGVGGIFMILERANV